MPISLPNITDYQDMQCWLFAKYSYDSSLDEYRKRNQFNKNKIIKDIYNGKKAEFLVYNYLVRKGKKLNSPDVNIYDKRNKSYDADLSVDGINIHVKSHLKNENYPVSWVFQTKDPLLFKKNDNDYLALVVVSDKSYMYVKYISKVSFKDPIKKVLKTNKSCVYEKDIRNFKK